VDLVTDIISASPPVFLSKKSVVVSVAFKILLDFVLNLINRVVTNSKSDFAKVAAGEDFPLYASTDENSSIWLE
jgi:hypothetical protein